MSLQDLFVKDDELIFVIQWHFTDSCDFKCKHCYIDRDSKKELTLEQMKPTIDEFSDVTNRML